MAAGLTTMAAVGGGAQVLPAVRRRAVFCSAMPLRRAGGAGPRALQLVSGARPGAGSAVKDAGRGGLGGAVGRKPSARGGPGAARRAPARTATVAEAEGLVLGKGAKIKPLLYSAGIGAALWFCPCPPGLNLQAWHLFACFVGTIVGIITQPVPLGAVALLGLGSAMLTKTMTFAQAYSAMANEIPWLIALAFFFARGFIKTGLGNRIAYLFVRAFGATSLGLVYSLVFAEALLAPAIPSVAARAGGIMLPLAKSLCEASGSNVGDGTEGKLGAYLMTTCFQTSCISSAMFLTGMAANPLAVNLAGSILGFQISWTQWFMGAIAPGLAALVAIPAILYAVFPPEVKESPDAPKLAADKLASMGPMSQDEKLTAGSLLLTVALWIAGPGMGIGNVAAASVGLAILLISGVLQWKECLGEGVAWDTLTWFGALIAMAAHLNSFGFISWFSGQVTGVIGGLGLAWQPAFAVLMLVYFYCHYLFASGAAHIGAMYTAFLAVCVSLGAPAFFAALFMAYASNLMGGLTHYGIGSAPPFYGAGYVPLAQWWKMGFLCSIVNLLLFGVGGMAWMSVIGYL